MEFFKEFDVIKAIISGDYEKKILHDYDNSLIKDEYIYTINDTLYLIVDGNCPIDSKQYHADIEYKEGSPYIINVKQPEPIGNFEVSKETLIKFGYIVDDVNECTCDCELCNPVKKNINIPTIISKFGEIMSLREPTDGEQKEQRYDYSDISDYSDYSDYSDNELP